MAKQKLVAYQETYRDHYPVDASLTDEEAVEKIRNDIMIGKKTGRRPVSEATAMLSGAGYSRRACVILGSFRL